jgi:hypothetical protein
MNQADWLELEAQIAPINTWVWHSRMDGLALHD